MTERKYLLFHEDRTTLMAIGKWFKESQGKLPLKDLERKLQERFGFVTKTLYTEEQMKEMAKTLPHLRYQAYTLEGDIVYQNQRCQSLESSPHLSLGF